MAEFAELGYLGLFIASFLAATVVPFSSEVVFSALVFGGLDPWICVIWLPLATGWAVCPVIYSDGLAKWNGLKNTCV